MAGPGNCAAGIVVTQLGMLFVEREKIRVYLVSRSREEGQCVVSSFFDRAETLPCTAYRSVSVLKAGVVNARQWSEI